MLAPPPHLHLNRPHNHESFPVTGLLTVIFSLRLALHSEDVNTVGTFMWVAGSEPTFLLLGDSQTFHSAAGSVPVRAAPDIFRAVSGSGLPAPKTRPWFKMINRSARLIETQLNEADSRFLRWTGRFPLTQGQPVLPRKPFTARRSAARASCLSRW